MEEAVRQALVAAGFTTDEIQLETTEHGNVSGFLFSQSFVGVPQIERQNQLWARLGQLLTPDQLHHIVAILTMTPDEVEDDVRVTNE